MMETSAFSIPGILIERSGVRQAPATRMYRLRKSFAVVHFEQTGKGRVVFLPAGAELRVTESSSCLCECCEVMYDGQLYNIFIRDLLGPWSNPIESSLIESTGSNATRPIRAVGART
jgi:hypothetical protein